MATAPRMTLQTKLVLAALAAQDLVERRYGQELRKVIDLPAGTIYPILARLERAGFVESEWEDPAHHIAGRPLRRYYTLTPAGIELARGISDRTLRAVMDHLGIA